MKHRGTGGSTLNNLGSDGWLVITGKWSAFALEHSISTVSLKRSRRGRGANGKTIGLTHTELNLQLFKPVLTLYDKPSIVDVNVNRTVLFWEQTELKIAEAADLPPWLWDWAFRSGLSAWSLCWQTLSEEVTHIFTLVKPLLPDFSFFPWASAVARATCAWRTRQNVYTVYSFWSDSLYGKTLQMNKHDKLQLL